jgi:hypothetical protein
VFEEGKWGKCSKACGKGVQSRSRKILKNAANGGKKCGSTKQRRACNSKACPKKKGELEYIGCYKDNESRDLKHGPKKRGYSPESCKTACPAYKYFALQDGGWCNCDNSYSTPESKYPKQPDSECNKGGRGYGGWWRNAVYKTDTIGYSCHSFETGQDNNWCQSAGWPYVYTGGNNVNYPGCSTCWCCKANAGTAKKKKPTAGKKKPTAGKKE